MSGEKTGKSKFTIIGVERSCGICCQVVKNWEAQHYFAYHASALGANSYIVSSVGDDELGR